ncbi:Crp/Fnr family transcriptional regulator [Chitinophaga sp. GbtcB8]|uniref:Crp/Fnr family transcriptional regulator n=1 Tax=Chitinophaga sp. GbtcB8 TaxID=2824753 RepID=UPI001C3022FC|nr:Crp/Fnr family transcriptional regulator [Chitinophaga sp. GbtcB8]
METVIAQIDDIYSISNQAKKALSERFLCDTFSPKITLLKENEICEYAYFVVSGLLRRFYIQDDKEVTCTFIKKNQWAISPYSFYHQEPGHDYIETITETQVVYISFQDVQELCASFPELYIVDNHYLRSMIIQTITHSRLLRLKAKDRLALFMKAHADLFSIAPQKHIASFLGLAEETLSRRRGK